MEDYLANRKGPQPGGTPNTGTTGGLFGTGSQTPQAGATTGGFGGFGNNNQQKPQTGGFGGKGYLNVNQNFVCSYQHQNSLIMSTQCTVLFIVL